jgi:hypothetical protein
LNLVRSLALSIAILQRSQSIAVQRYVGIHGIGVKILPQHQHGLAMLVAAAAEERNIGRQRNITGSLLPSELESVRG